MKRRTAHPEFDDAGPGPTRAGGDETDMTSTATAVEVLRQHLIDPEICIRCNTCEETCPIHAISHDSRNYVVDPAICKACMVCVPPCPTGAIDSWRQVVRSEAYGLAEQLEWDALPAQQEIAGAGEPVIPEEVVEITTVATSDRAVRWCPLVGRAPVRQPLCDPASRDRHRQRKHAAHRRRHRRTSATSCSTSGRSPFRCSKARP